MNKSKKMKLSYVTVLGFLVLGLFSCNNENEILNSAKENQLPEVEVSNLSAWSNGTRSSNGTQDEKVLRFRDLETYRKVLSKLSGMTDEEKTSYFLNLPPEKVGKTFDSTVKNFQSGKCGDARGNQTFKNITVM